MSTHHPTMRFRWRQSFSERDAVPIRSGGWPESPRFVVLQQWWAMDTSGADVYPPDGRPGEWRDVPLEND